MIENLLERIAIALEKIVGDKQSQLQPQPKARLTPTEDPNIALTSQAQATAPPVQEPKAPSYTASQLGLMCRQLADQGKLPVIQEMFQNFGISALDQLPQEKYGDFANQLILQGAKL